MLILVWSSNNSCSLPSIYYPLLLSEVHLVVASHQEFLGHRCLMIFVGIGISNQVDLYF